MLDAKAVLFGSPTLNGGMFPTVSDMLTYVKGLKPKGKNRLTNVRGISSYDSEIAAAFGSYGWSGEAVSLVEKELEGAGFEVIKSGLNFVYFPDDDELKKCFEFGVEVAEKIREKTI
jgi:flavorubredoxin